MKTRYKILIGVGVVGYVAVAFLRGITTSGANDTFFNRLLDPAGNFKEIFRKR